MGNNHLGKMILICCSIAFASPILGGCSAPKDAISLNPSANQQAITRDGIQSLVSEKRHVVFLRPLAAQQARNGRPQFVLAMLNRGKAQSTFRVADLDVTSTSPRRAKMRVYTHAELAREVEENRNAALFLSALSGVAGAVSASQAGYTHTTGSIATTSPYGSSYSTYSGSTYSPALAHAAADANARRTANDMAAIEGEAQRMLSHLQATVIKDHTLMPGEWHGGIIVFDPPEKGNAGADYSITLRFDGEEHSFSITQRNAT